MNEDKQKKETITGKNDMKIYMSWRYKKPRKNKRMQNVFFV